MHTPVRWREGDIGRAPARVRPGTNGVLYVQSDDALDAHPERITDRLVHWAGVAPERTLFARRGPDGQWVRIGYAQMLERARRVGQALLGRSLSAERPLMILSDNDLEHATLAFGALYAGVPFVPVSPAYSLVAKDFGKLRRIVELLAPGLVFAADAARFAPAIAAAVPAGVEVVSTRGKAGITGVTRALAREWGRYKVNVNAVAFGLIATRMTQAVGDEGARIDVAGRALPVGIPEQAVRAIEAQIPLGRGGTPEEAAGAVYLFCIPESDYVSGQVLLVTGGQ